MSRLGMALVLALLLILSGVGLWEGGKHKGNAIGAARVQAAWDRETAVRTQAALKAEQEQRAIDHQRTTDLAEVSRHAAKIQTQRRAEAVASAALDVRVRTLSAALAAAADHPAGGDPGVAAGGAPAAGPGLVLRGMFEGADDAAGILAPFADDAHEAGLACERAYAALRKKTPG